MFLIFVRSLFLQGEVTSPDKEKAVLKKKYANAQYLQEADQVIYMRAFDISEHFSSNWKGTGFKAQLVAPNKAAAIKYHKFLNDIGLVSSEVIISAPDLREGHDDVLDDAKDEVVKFWDKMMKSHGDSKSYESNIISSFKTSEGPDILIVVDKLLTGFDAPLNTVMYLCRVLREHTLLQAIARVNRLCEGKDFGYIVDYANIFGELKDALTMYDVLSEFDQADISGSLTSISEEVKKLPQKYSVLWDVFKEVKNKHDEEAFELLLSDEEIRDDFYDKLTSYSKSLSIALSTDDFIKNTDNHILDMYKSDLNFFYKLKKSVSIRYADNSFDEEFYSKKN